MTIINVNIKNNQLKTSLFNFLFEICLDKKGVLFISLFSLHMLKASNMKQGTYHFFLLLKNQMDWVTVKTNVGPLQEL